MFARLYEYAIYVEQQPSHRMNNCLSNRSDEYDEVEIVAITLQSLEACLDDVRG